MATILENITAVETLLILENGETSFNDLFKCVVLDLALKKVIYIKDVTTILDPKHAYNLVYTYIYKGDHFDNYNFSSYELHIKNILNSYTDGLKIILFRNLLHKKFYAEFDWVEEIIKVSSIKKLFNENYFLKFWGSLPLNDNGEAKAKEITNTLNNSYEYTNPLDLANTVIRLGSNIFLLRNFDTNDLLKINGLDAKSLKKVNNNYLYNLYINDSNYFNEKLIKQFNIKRWF